jgi:hypothetical protein
VVLGDEFGSLGRADLEWFSGSLVPSGRADLGVKMPVSGPFIDDRLY